METLMRLRVLRSIGQHLLTERSGDLGFGQWDCGTYACLLGHYERRAGVQIHRDYQAQHSYGVAALHFGISRKEAGILFGKAKRALFRPKGERANGPGPEAYDELERRMKRLDKMIASLERKHGKPLAIDGKTERPKLRAVG